MAGSSNEPDDAPDDGADAGLAGDLSSATDREWLEGHLNLIASAALPPEETRFLFDPDRDPATVNPEDLTEDGQPRG